MASISLLTSSCSLEQMQNYTVWFSTSGASAGMYTILYINGYEKDTGGIYGSFTGTLQYTYSSVSVQVSLYNSDGYFIDSDSMTLYATTYTANLTRYLDGVQGATFYISRQTGEYNASELETIIKENYVPAAYDYSHMTMTQYGKNAAANFFCISPTYYSIVYTNPEGYSGTVPSTVSVRGGNSYTISSNYLSKASQSTDTPTGSSWIRYYNAQGGSSSSSSTYHEEWHNAYTYWGDFHWGTFYPGTTIDFVRQDYTLPGKLTSTTIESTYAAKSPALPSAARNGYTFDGWYTESSGGTYVGKSGDLIAPTSNGQVVYAHWTATIHTLTYTDEESYHTSGWPDPSVESHPTDDEFYLASAPLSEIKTEVPESDFFTVSFNYKGHTPSSPVTELYAYAYHILTTTRIFQHWLIYSVAYRAEAQYTMPYYNVEAQAIWGTPTEVEGPVLAGYVTLPDVEHLEHYKFAGWYSDQACTVFVGNAGDKYTPNANITLYAKWEYVSYPVKLTYNCNGGAKEEGSITTLWSDPDTGYFNSGYPTHTFKCTSVIPYYAHKDFQGWKRTWDSNIFHAGDNIVVYGEANIEVEDIVYAQWMDHQYTLTLQKTPSQGGTVTGAGSYIYGQTVTLTATPATNYEWIGWYTTSGSLISSARSYQFTMPGQNITYVAKFKSPIPDFYWTSGSTDTDATSLVAGANINYITADVWNNRLKKTIEDIETYKGMSHASIPTVAQGDTILASDLEAVRQAIVLLGAPATVDPIKKNDVMLATIFANTPVGSTQLSIKDALNDVIENL